MHVMSTQIPVRFVHGSHSPPWLTKEMKRAFERKEGARKAAKRTGCAKLWNTYRRLRNRAVALLRHGKRSFYDRFSKSKSPKEFWGAYHALTGQKQRMPTVMHRGDVEVSTLQAKADLLNCQFAFVYSPLRLSHHLADLPSDVPHISSVSCSFLDTIRGITRLSSNTASGPDGISSRMLKLSASSIAGFLTDLFNRSLCTDVVPSAWKLSHITLIFKSGDPTDVANYRPISLLPLVCKLLERQVHNTIMNHLCRNGLLSSKQYGFRAGASTQEAVLSLTK